MPGCPFWKEKFPRERLKEIFADRASNILEFIEEDLLFQMLIKMLPYNSNH